MSIIISIRSIMTKGHSSQSASSVYPYLTISMHLGINVINLFFTRVGKNGLKMIAQDQNLFFCLSIKSFFNGSFPASSLFTSFLRTVNNY